MGLLQGADFNVHESQFLVRPLSTSEAFRIGLQDSKGSRETFQRGKLRSMPTLQGFEGVSEVWGKME